MIRITIVLALCMSFAIRTQAQIKAPSANDRSAGMELKTGTAVLPGNQGVLKSTNLQWYTLPSPTLDEVTEASIAGDGPVLVIFYHKPRPTLNTDEGIVEKWTGTSWSNVAQATNQCHYPDIDVSGSVVVTTWNDDGNDYGYGTNINGNWVSLTGTLLYKQWYPRATMAMGFPYMSFTCKYSDGMPSTYDMLHIKSPVGVGDKIELNGGWSVTYTSVGSKTDITGDENAWYCVFSQQQFLYVKKGSVQDGTREYAELGEGFRMYNPVARPEIALFQGRPIVAWMENENTELYVAEWDGSQWWVIGSAALDYDAFNSIRMASSPSELFLITTSTESGSEISVNSYDGDQWYSLPDVQNVPGASIGTADIAVHNNDPVIAYTEDNKLVVKKLSESSPSGSENTDMDDHGLRCYPNPTNGIIEIMTPESGMYSIEIKSPNGQTLLSESFNGDRTEIDISSYGEGVYFLTIGSGDHYETRKIIKQ